jgi:hypothetical protein
VKFQRGDTLQVGGIGTKGEYLLTGQRYTHECFEDVELHDPYCSQMRTGSLVKVISSVRSIHENG